MGPRWATGKFSSEPARKGIPDQRAGGAAPKGGVGETGAPAGGEPVVKVGHRHVMTRSDLADSSRTIRDIPRLVDVLRGIPQDEARVRTVGNGRGTIDADVRGRGVHFHVPLCKKYPGTLPSDSGEEEHRRSPNLCGGRNDGVPTGRNVR